MRPAARREPAQATVSRIATRTRQRAPNGADSVCAMALAAPLSSPPSVVSRQATIAALVLLTSMNLLNYIDRYVLPAIVESVKRDIPMTDGEQGIALTSFIWVYMLAAPVFGRLGDTRSRKHLIALGVALWSLATAAAAFSKTYPQLLAARALVGVGEAAYATIAPSLIGDYFPREKRGGVMSLFYMAIPVGSALGYVSGGAIEKAFSWRAAFLAVGLPGLLLAGLALFITEAPRGQYDADPQPPSLPLRDALGALFKNREYVLLVTGLVAYTFALGALAQWMPAYLIRIRHLDSAKANGIFGLITVTAGLLGTVTGGALGEWLKRRTRHPYLCLSGFSTLVAVPLSVMAFVLPSVSAMWAAAFAAEFFVFMCTGPSNTVIINAVPASTRTMAFAAAIFAQHALGDALSPAMVGFVSERSSLPLAVMLVPLAFGVGAAVWLYAWRALPEGKHA